jgi:Mg2+-importing ATPase
MNKKVNENIINYSKMKEKEILHHFKSNLKGLSYKKVNEILLKIGPNKIEDQDHFTLKDLFIKAFLNPFSILLIGIILISILTDVIFSKTNDYSTIIILTFIIVISGLMHFIQELRSRKSLNELKQLVINTTAVLREGKIEEIPLNDLVPGDIIKLSAGDIIPADIRILSCKDLFVSQSSFTGESEPVEKLPNNINKDNNIFDTSNICFLGTNVISGSATAIVIETGSNTYLGHMSKTIIKKEEQTAFDIGINKVSGILIKITLIMTPLVFIINMLTKGHPLTAFIFALTVAVGTTPELLPMIINSNLAKGSISMSKNKVIVKNLNSIQNLGAIDILCTDKTGTITEDNIILDEYLDIYGNEEMGVLKYAYLNSHFQTGLKNLLDKAIISRALENKLEGLLPNYNKIDEIPFDFNRRRMSIILEKKNKEKTLITKGATEEILAISSYIEHEGKIIKINNDLKKTITAVATRLNEKGLRVIAVAKKDVFLTDASLFTKDDEKEMIMIGFVSFLDPPKASAKEAIKLLNEYGIKVKVITGDNELVAKNVCSQVGIKTTNSLTGNDLDTMTKEELLKIINETTLFSKISPLQKAYIIKLLKEKGHIVGYMGDGVNDAPALIEADVGISVDSGVEIAKETANIILLEKSLLVLEKGIIEGRKIFANIMKYLNMAISSNVGNMISVILASILLPFLPLLPIHILIQNLLYDFSQTGIPFDKVDKNYLKKPRKWATTNITRFIAWFAPLSSVFDLIIFAILWFIIGANTISNQALFHSGWFMMGIISQTLIVHIIRTEKIPFFKSLASPIIIFTTIIISLIGFILPSTQFGSLIGLVILPKVYTLWLIIIILTYMLLTEFIKMIYIKKYKDWL